MGLAIFSVICGLMSASLCVYLCYQFFSKKISREERIENIRNYKKGKFALIYAITSVLYCGGSIAAQIGEGGEKYGEIISTAIIKSIPMLADFAAFKFEKVLDVLSPLKLNGSIGYWPFVVALHISYLIIIFSTVMFVYSLCGQLISRYIKERKMEKSEQEHLYIIGNNENSISIYRSDKNKNNKIIIDSISKEDCYKLYKEDILYKSTSAFDWLEKKIAKYPPENKNTFIINTGDDEKNIKLCNIIVDRIAEIVRENLTDKGQLKPEVHDKLFSKLSVYVFGDPKYLAIYENIVEKGKGCILYVNKYQKIAMDFIDKYPISLFMDENHIDFKNSLVKDDVNINVTLIGFGKTNQQIFLTSVANNQFITAGEGDPDLKPVRYFIFDKEHADNNKNLNHSYYRFKHEILGEYPDVTTCPYLNINNGQEVAKNADRGEDAVNKEDYLELPALPAEEKFFHLDINDFRFYNNIKEIVTGKQSDINFVIIAFGDDLENIDMAHKILEKRNEWELKNLYIFVKVRTWHEEQTMLENEDFCFFIGHENDSVYSIDKITNYRFHKMQKMRNEMYDIEYAKEVEEENKKKGKKTDPVDYVEVIRGSARSWYNDKCQAERDSNFYCCLNLRSKLHMMNLDYSNLEEDAPLRINSNNDYLEIYAKNDPPVFGQKIDMELPTGEKIVKDTIVYDIDKYKPSRRRNMAFQEHQRWNSYMITRGLVPATKSQILNEKSAIGKPTNGKNYKLRHHGNLTTFKGLEDFRRILAKRDNEVEQNYDKIKYDYQILDDAYWLLEKNGYSIIRKKPVDSLRRNKK